jgi:hypothetical protein
MSLDFSEANSAANRVLGLDRMAVIVKNIHTRQEFIYG